MEENTEKKVNAGLLHRRELQEGEFTRVERLFRENKYFSFTAGDRIESVEDVAYIFKQLETASVENSFAVFVKDGVPTVLHLGIGTFDQVLVNNRAFKLAFDRLQPEQTYFVHNHPSGNIRPSSLDRRAAAQLETAIGTDIVNIIINTTSGKYSIFTSDSTLDAEMAERKEASSEVGTYSFDTQVFSEDYDPSADSIRDSRSIAAFISSHRLGKRGKINALILNNNLGVVGNILLDKNKIEMKDVPELAKKIFDDTITFGGFSVVLYGSGLNKSQERAINELSSELRKSEVRLTDVVSILKSTDSYLSFSDAGILRDESAEYSASAILGDEDYTALYKMRGRPIKSTKEARELLEGIGYNAGLSNLITGRNGEKFVKYKANGVVTPNIVLGETTPYDVMYQFLLYGNVHDLNIPQVVREQFEAERQEQRDVHKSIELDTIEQIKRRLRAEHIAFAEVTDSERGYRIAFNHAKTENGNFINYFDVADMEALEDYMDYIRKKSIEVRQQFTKSGAADMQLELDFDNAFEEELPVNKSDIQGLERYSEEEIKKLITEHIFGLTDYNLPQGDEQGEFAVVGMAIHGSRGRGDAKKNSDLDVVVEYMGDYKEDAVFNLLNDEKLEIDGIKVDINPIRREQTGTLGQYMVRSAIYDEIKKLENTPKDSFAMVNVHTTIDAFKTGDASAISLAKELFEKYRRHYIENSMAKGVDLGHMAAVVLGSNAGVIERAKARHAENPEEKWVLDQIETENSIDSKVFAEYGASILEDKENIYKGDHIYIPNNAVGTVVLVESIDGDNVIYHPYEYGEPSDKQKTKTMQDLRNNSNIMVFRNTKQFEQKETTRTAQLSSYPEGMSNDQTHGLHQRSRDAVGYFKNYIEHFTGEIVTRQNATLRTGFKTNIVGSAVQLTFVNPSTQAKSYQTIYGDVDKISSWVKAYALENKKEKQTSFSLEEWTLQQKEMQTSAQSEKIEDWGEMIAGARKDMMKEISASIDGITKEALKDNAISKIWKRPDYAKMVEKGEMTAEDALVMESITRAILSVPKPRFTTRASLQARKLAEWTEGITKSFGLLKQYAEATDKGKETVRKHLREDITRASVTYNVLKELGYPAVRIERFTIPGIQERKNADRSVVYSGPNLFRVSKEEAKADTVRYVKTALGFDDLTYTPNDFYVRPEYKTTVFETGRYIVRTYISTFHHRENTFATEAEAMEYSARQEQLGHTTHIEPEKQWRHDITGYMLRVKDSFKRDTHLVSDIVFATEAELNEYVINNLPELEAKANEIISAKYSTENKTTAADRLNLFIEYDRENGKPGFAVYLGMDKVTARGNLVKLAFFEEWKDAKKWADEHREGIATRLAEMNKQHRNGTEFRPARPRVGEDYRGGRDITVEELGTTFGFRGIQFGNWTNQEDRQRAINEAYDGLMDMSKVLGVSPKALSLGGELAMAFGARGVGGFSAHYERMERVINLTKTQGAGSLAHEWWHAIDNYFGRHGWSDDTAMATDTWRNGENQLRDEVQQAIKGFVGNINNSEYFKRCQFSDYWGSTVELTARYFAEYMKRKIETKGVHNDFLSHSITSEENYRKNMYNFYKAVTAPEKQMTFEEFKNHPQSLYRYAYPTQSEMEQINPSLDNLFATLNEKIENDKTILYDQHEEEEITPERKRLGEVAVEMLRKAGLNVVLDREQMRRAIETSPSEIQKMAIEEANERFNRELSEQIAGTQKQGHIYHFGMPSAILQSAGIPYLPIELAASRLSDKSIQEEHPFDLSEVNGLVKAIQNPLVVFRSATHVGSNVILTELEHNGRNFVVAIETNRQQGRLLINSVRSVHYRKSALHIINWLNANLADYIKPDFKKNWLDRIEKELLSKPQYNSADVRKQLNSAANIVENFENPKISSEILQKMTVFHGSPYSFDKFDHQYMDKGEGAQSHGWGTYVAVSRNVGEAYARMAKGVRYVGPESKLTDKGENWMPVLLHELAYYNKKHDEPIEVTLENIKKWTPETSGESQYLIDYAQRFNAEDFVSESRNLYEVEIPEKGLYLEEGRIVTKSILERVMKQAEAEGLDANFILQQKEVAERHGGARVNDYHFRGADLYDTIKVFYQAREIDDPNNSSAREASKFLERAGFKGIHYNGQVDGECYVIFNEEDLTIRNHTQYLKTTGGEVYGFVKNNTIYLDPEVLNANTAIHEYTHLWTRALRQTNPVLWEHGKQLLKDTPFWSDVKNDPNYSDIVHDDNLIASEVLARLSGRDGEYLLNDIATYYKKKGIMAEMETDNFIERIKQLIDKAWRYIKDTFMPWTETEASRISIREFVEMPIKDLLNGVNPLQQMTDQQIADEIINGQVQYHIGKKAREQYERLLDRKQPDMPKQLRKQALDYLESLEDNRENNKKVKIAITWLANGRIRLPEDMSKVDDAISVAEKAKIEPMSYAGPMELLNAHKEYKPTRAPLAPDNMPGLYNKQELAHGVTVYDVADTMAARESMRQIINTHFGEDCNPWCVLQGNGHGWLTEDSQDYWDDYDQVQRMVAFQDGHLVAFRASQVSVIESEVRQQIVEELSEEYGIKLSLNDFNNSITWDVPMFGEEDIPAIADRLGIDNHDFDYEEYSGNPDYAFDFDGLKQEVEMALAEIMEARFDNIPEEEAIEYLGKETWWDRQDESHVGIPIKIRSEKIENAKGIGELYLNGRVSEPPYLEVGHRTNGKFVEYSRKGDEYALTEESHWKDGKRDGLSVRYNNLGRTIFYGNYADGKQVGFHINSSLQSFPSMEMFDKDGNMQWKESYRSDFRQLGSRTVALPDLDGEIIAYFNDDKEVTQYKLDYFDSAEDKKHTEYINYSRTTLDDEPRRYVSQVSSYVNGMEISEISFFENGGVKEQKQFTYKGLPMSQKNWYSDGQQKFSLEVTTHKKRELRMEVYKWNEVGEVQYHIDVTGSPSLIAHLRRESLSNIDRNTTKIITKEFDPNNHGEAAPHVNAEAWGRISQYKGMADYHTEGLEQLNKIQGIKYHKGMEENMTKGDHRLAVTQELIERLRSMGIDVQLYTNDSMAQNNISGQQSHVFTDNSQMVYGFTAEGKIYLNQDTLNPETPIHEYTHLWAEALRMKQPEEWNQVVEMMKTERRLWTRIQRDYPQLTSDDEVAEEVLAHYSGKRGSERFIQQYGADVHSGIIDKIFQAIEKFWKAVTEMFMTPWEKERQNNIYAVPDNYLADKESLADSILVDFLMGNNPAELTKEKLYEQASNDRVANVPRVVYEALKDSLGEDAADKLSVALPFLEYTPREMNIGFPYDVKETPWSFRVQDYTTDYARQAAIIDAIHPSEDLQQLAEDSSKYAILDYLSRGGSLYNMAGEEYLWNLPEEIGNKFVEAEHILLEIQDFPSAYEDRQELIAEFNKLWKDYEKSLCDYLGVENIYEVGDRKDAFKASFKKLDRRFRETVSEYNAVMAELPDSVYNRYATGEVHYHKQNVREDNVNKVDWNGKLRVFSSSPYLPVRNLSHKVKEGNAEALDKAAGIMSVLVKRIPDYRNAVLVPIPNRSGHAEYTRELASKIANTVGVGFYDILTGVPHEPLYQEKAENGIDGLQLMQFDVKEGSPLPDRHVILIDNVLDTGTTAMSAMRTFGRDCSLVVLGNTTNYRRYNYPVSVKIMPVLNINFTKEESERQKEALVNRFERLARLTGKQVDVEKLFKKDRFQNWDDVLKASEKGVERIVYDNQAGADDMDDIRTSARKTTERIFKEDAASRLNKEVLAVLGESEINLTDLKRPNGNTVSVRLSDKRGIDYTDRSWSQLFEGMQSLPNRDYDSLVGQVVNEVNKRLLAAHFSETDGRDIIGRMNFTSSLATADGGQLTAGCYKLSKNEDGALVISVASEYSDFAAKNEKVMDIDNFVASDRAQILAEVMKTQKLTSLQTIFADNYTVGDKIELIQEDAALDRERDNELTQTKTEGMDTYQPQFINNKNQDSMEENVEKKLDEQPVEQPQEQQAAKPKKSRWDGYDYSKHKFPEGVTVENPNVFKKDTPEGVRYSVTAVINGKRYTKQLYYNDVNAFFEKDENGVMTRRVTREMLAAKYFAKEFMPKEEVAEQQAEKAAESHSFEENIPSKLIGEYDIPVYAIPYFKNGEEGLEGLSEEDVKAILEFEKSLPVPFITNLPDDIDSAKQFIDAPAFGNAADCVKMEVRQLIETIEETVRDEKHAEHHEAEAAEHVQEEEAEKQVAAAKEQAEKEEAARKEEQRKQEEARKEEEMKEKEAEEQKPQPKIQAVLLATALSAALAKDGIWLNESGKKHPQMHGGNAVISPFNALAMALNSDQKGYKTNVYTNFGTAKAEGFSVRSKQEALPFNWYDWNKYTNRYNSSDVIDRATYEALPAEEKELYRSSKTLKIQNIFNIDQTLMKHQKGDMYKGYVEQQAASVADSREKQIEVEKAKVDSYKELEKNRPDTIVLLRDGDFYQAYGGSAEEIGKLLDLSVTEMASVQEDNGQPMKLVSFPAHQLDEYLPKIVRSGTKVAISDQIENPALKQLGEEGAIYAKMEELAKALVAADGSVAQTNLSETRFEDGKLSITLNRKAEPGQEMTTALGRLNDLYRAAVSWTGTEERLGRQTRQNMLPEDAAKYDRLVHELAAGALMLRQGLPARISSDNIALSEYWQRELREDPSILTRIERDVNNAVKVLSDIQQGKAQEIDYSQMRGDKMKTVNQTDYTITSEISSYANLEDKTIVLVKHPESKSVDVILPQGASLNEGEDISGMNKNRIRIALSKEGYDGKKVTFYNAGGALGLTQPNEYYKDKEVEIVRLKQYQLLTVSKVDVPATLVKLNDIQFRNVQMIRDDNNRWALYVAPVKGQGEAFAVYPEDRDTKRFFEAVKKEGSMNTVVQEIGKKYFNLVKQHPTLKADFLMPKIEDADILNRITRVNITQDKNNERSIVMWAEIDGKVQAPRELTQTQYQRFFLVPDQEAYKLGLAAEMFKDKLIAVVPIEQQTTLQPVEQPQQQEEELEEQTDVQVEEEETAQRSHGRGM